MSDICVDVALGSSRDLEIDTHSVATGATTNADSTPTWTSYKNGNTAIQSSQNFTNRTTGEYYATVTFSSGNGYAVGDNILIRASATVGGITAKKSWAFRVTPTEASTGVYPANVTYYGGSTGTFSGGRPEVNASHAGGTAWASGAITAASIASNAITAAKIAADAIGATQIAADAITASKIATDAINASKIAPGAIDADALAADAAQEIADTLLDRTSGIETNYTLRQTLRLVLAALSGRLSGAATSTVTIRDINNTKNRIVATVDADGNRSDVTVDIS